MDDLVESKIRMMNSRNGFICSVNFGNLGEFTMFQHIPHLIHTCFSVQTHMANIDKVRLRHRNDTSTRKKCCSFSRVPLNNYFEKIIV